MPIPTIPSIPATPLQGVGKNHAGGQDNTPPTVSTATIIVTGDSLTLVFSEPVNAVIPAEYALSTGQAFGIASTGDGGKTWNVSITPAVNAGATPTLAYTGTSTKDAANNRLAMFSGRAITNNSTVSSGPAYGGELGSASGGGGVTSFGPTLTAGAAAGKRVVVTVYSSSSGASAVVDSKGNTYTLDANTVGASVNIHIFSAVLATPLVATDTITATFGFALADKAVDAVWLDNAATAVDQTKAATGSSTAAATGNSGATTTANEIAIGAVVSGINNTFGSVAPYTRTAASPINGSLLVGYQVLSATGVQSFSCTLGSISTWAALLVTYR